MRRVGVLICAVLALFLISSVNPFAYSIPAARGNEVREASFFTAADGAESSESILEFHETTDDDVPLFPDSPMAEKNRELANWHANQQATDNWSVVLTSGAGSEGSASDGDMCELWHTRDEAGWVIGGSTDPFSPAVTYGNDYWAFLKIQASDPTTTVRIIFVWEDTGYYMDYGPSETISDSDCHIISAPMDDYTGGHDLVGVGVRFTGDGSSNVSLSVDWVQVVSGYPEDSASVYSEPFLDVSDITVGIGETVTTDGDLGTFHHPGDNAWDYYFWNDPSALAVQVIEWRCHANISSSSYEFALYSADDGGGSQLWTSGSITAPTSAGTKKYSPMVTGVESIRLATRHASSPAAFIFDYLRGSLSTESGFCHDGSTTAGVTDGGGAETTFTASSDSDILTLNITTGAGASGSASFYINFDTTTTKADLERDYYPFVEMKARLIENTGAGAALIFASDGYFTYLDSNFVETSWTTYRVNHKASTTSHAYEACWFYWGAGASSTIEIQIDYAKAASIANFTVTQSGATTDDYLYTDSGVLYSNIDDGYIEMNHDPALSVSDTYSVWNLTTSGTAPEFSQYVSEWSAYSDETRGATTSGTVTDIKLKFDGTEILSAIKFIEDGTAPAVVRSSSTPNDPEDDESTTLSAVITDTVEVYSVAFNAIVYPTGFSDVDYSANEQADNLWNYTFSSLDAGYYCFKIIASDGANTNALTEYAYIEITVREAAIRVEEITLIGAGSDFTMMTFSARINRDCSFTIYEESASSPESDTHTGSVTAPSFNLAWTKLDVDDANVNFTIRFTSGSLTYNYTSQYQVAQTTFYVSTVTQMVSLDTVTVTGRITKLGAYQVYDDLDVLKDYGSITDLDFKIQFTRWGGYDEQNHDFAIKFTNGSQTCWFNSSFYAFKKPVVAAFQTTDPNALYAFQVSFWTLIAVVAIGGMVAVDFYRKEVK